MRSFRFCARGEFFPLVQLPDFSALYARHYFRQLVQGLAFMHRQNIAHRDLSLENILLDDKGNLKMSAHARSRPRIDFPTRPSAVSTHTSSFSVCVCAQLRLRCGRAVRRRERADGGHDSAGGQGEVLHAARSVRAAALQPGQGGRVDGRHHPLRHAHQGPSLQVRHRSGTRAS